MHVVAMSGCSHDSHDVVVRLLTHGQGSGVTNLCGDLLVEADDAVKAGTDGSAALCQLQQSRQSATDPVDAVLDLLGVARELLAQRQWSCILSGTSTVTSVSVCEFV